MRIGNLHNMAQAVLYAIGGTAELVAGINGHYWADDSTPSKNGRQRLTKTKITDEKRKHLRRIQKESRRGKRK
jgi:hypothetical protein